MTTVHETGENVHYRRIESVREQEHSDRTERSIAEGHKPPD